MHISKYASLPVIFLIASLVCASLLNPVYGQPSWFKPGSKIKIYFNEKIGKESLKGVLYMELVKYVSKGVIQTKFHYELESGKTGDFEENISPENLKGLTFGEIPVYFGQLKPGQKIEFVRTMMGQELGAIIHGKRYAVARVYPIVRLVVSSKITYRGRPAYKLTLDKY
ncbi:MAG: hypothetical protein DRJ52_07380, partial [Thermoprotei archaeon]